MKEMFKIRHKKTGMFSNGGENPTWSKNGKTWEGIGPLRLHLRQFKHTDQKLKDWEVVRYIEPKVSDPVDATLLYPVGAKWPNSNLEDNFFGWVWVDPHKGGCFVYPHEDHPENAVKVYR